MILDTRDIVEKDVAEAILGLDNLGKTQYDEFVANRLDNQVLPIDEPIKRNKILLLKKGRMSKKSAVSHQMSALKSDCSLFSRLYVSCQIRSGDLDDFFAHENQNSPVKNCQ